MPTRQGSFHLFRILGIDVYIHFLWFLAVIYYVSQTTGYDSPIWSVGECMAMFMIVLIHEFGHAFACRSVGGKADEIVLWLFGGVAYVRPPERPGAQLWSIAAGPLVNVVLIPILTGAWFLADRAGWNETAPETLRLLYHIQGINILLLFFNMMPIYPLDGGQILRSVLWFVFGRANSLLIASTIGFIGIGALVIGALIGLVAVPNKTYAVWAFMMAVFVSTNCWAGLKYARVLARVAKLPRREGFACPSCKTAPPAGEYWRCAKCGKQFDTFLTMATCPHCGTQYNATQCLDCGTSAPIGAWQQPP
jgi:Zn-dependent protease